MNARRVFQVIAVVIASCVSASAREKNALVARVDPAQIEVSLEPDQAEICLGEPLHLSFIVKNNSDRNLLLSVGGDYQNGLGRPDSFTVIVKNEAGVVLPKREAFENMGGLMFEQKIPALGSYRFRLFLPHWAIVKEPGVYHITAKRILNFSTEANEKFGDVPEEAETKIKVAPADAEKLGHVIAALGEKILGARNADGPEWTDLREIADERVVPILLKALEKDDYGAKFQALDGLAKFNTDEALAGLKQGMAVMEVGNASTAKLRQELAQNIRHCAAASLSKSPHPGALPFLLAQRHDSSYAVRMTALHAIAHRLDREHALPLLQEMTADENAQVSGEAKRYLKALSNP